MSCDHHLLLERVAYFGGGAAFLWGVWGEGAQSALPPTMHRVQSLPRIIPFCKKPDARYHDLHRMMMSPPRTFVTELLQRRKTRGMFIIPTIEKKSVQCDAPLIEPSKN
jgi:hypothetical protein